jgi:hypothetical protein
LSSEHLYVRGDSFASSSLVNSPRSGVFGISPTP